jgi:hypothetical protein
MATEEMTTTMAATATNYLVLYSSSETCAYLKNSINTGATALASA